MNMRMSLIIMALVVSSSAAAGQVGNMGPASDLDATHSSSYRTNLGVGLGVPYGSFGGKLSVGSDRITGELGLGVVPLAWAKVFSLSGAYHFTDPAKSFRPKVTVSYSSAAGALAIVDGMSMETLYSETYPGLGAYVGADWSFGKSRYGLDMNVGWVLPFAGADKIQEDYDAAIAELRSQGYEVENEMNALNGIKIALGLSYTP